MHLPSLPTPLAAQTVCQLLFCVSFLGGSVSADDLKFLDAQVTLATDTTIAAAASGIVAELPVREGQSLEQGSLIAQLDDKKAHSDLQTALQALHVAMLESENDVDLRYAEMTLAVHQKEYEHSRSANQRFAGSISQSDLRRQDLVVEQSKLRIEQAQRDMEIRQAKVAELQATADSVRQVVAQHAIHSPVSGVVAQRLVDPGEWVSAGDPIVRVIDLTNLRIECFVEQVDIAKLSVGSEVEFLPTPSADVAYRGVLQFVASELHPVTGQARVWAEVGNHDGKLKSGMRGTLTVRGL